jgi:transglutaminase-like putative cysteine protease
MGYSINLQFESSDPSAYLEETEVIDFGHPRVRERVEHIRAQAASDEERARLAFVFARDEIRHSFDAPDALPVTIRASEAIEQRQGICFAKAHVLAALLRGLGIPAGFSYQRVVRAGTPESGFALHGLNAIFLPSLRKWLRLDPRGNKPGVCSEFSVDEEKLAYPIRPAWGEVDYPWVLVQPDAAVLAAMRRANDSRELFQLRPDELVVRR